MCKSVRRLGHGHTVLYCLPEFPAVMVRRWRTRLWGRFEGCLPQMPFMAPNHVYGTCSSDEPISYQDAAPPSDHKPLQSNPDEYAAAAHGDNALITRESVQPVVVYDLHDGFPNLQLSPSFYAPPPSPASIVVHAELNVASSSTSLNPVGLRASSSCSINAEDTVCDAAEKQSNRTKHVINIDGLQYCCMLHGMDRTLNMMQTTPAVVSSFLTTDPENTPFMSSAMTFTLSPQLSCLAMPQSPDSQDYMGVAPSFPSMLHAASADPHSILCGRNRFSHNLHDNVDEGSNSHKNRHPPSLELVYKFYPWSFNTSNHDTTSSGSDHVSVQGTPFFNHESHHDDTTILGTKDSYTFPSDLVQVKYVDNICSGRPTFNSPVENPINPPIKTEQNLEDPYRLHPRTFIDRNSKDQHIGCTSLEKHPSFYKRNTVNAKEIKHHVKRQDLDDLTHFPLTDRIMQENADALNAKCIKSPGAAGSKGMTRAVSMQEGIENESSAADKSICCVRCKRLSERCRDLCHALEQTKYKLMALDERVGMLVDMDQRLQQVVQWTQMSNHFHPHILR